MPCSKKSNTQDLFDYIFNDPEHENAGDSGTVYHKNNKPQSVSELTRRIRMLLEGTFDNIWVEGEISNFKAHTSGHYYFTLKDEHSQIPAVMFRNANWKLRFTPENGMLVVVTGSVQVYEPQGKYQIVCNTMEPSGVGALQIAFEQLKRKLAAEGLFDEARKRPLPVFPRTIGVVTSPGGAAIRDIINVLFRRFPACRLVVNPVPVQGEGAAVKIARAIEECNEINRMHDEKIRFDVLIVGRGGGSMEDLWAFNEETVARAIAASEIPVISAVGHEIDWTIADMAADRRAPTPSAAAELVVKPRDYWITRISENVRRINVEIDYRITSCSQWVARAVTHYAFKEPLRMIDSYRQQVDEYTSCLTGTISEKLRNCAERVQLSRSILRSAGSLFSSQVSRSAEILALRCRMLDNACNTILKGNLIRLDRCLDQLEALGPVSVVRRGYTITRNLATGAPVISTGDIHPGDSIETEFRDGTAHSTVKRVTRKPEDSDAGQY